MGFVWAKIEKNAPVGEGLLLLKTCGRFLKSKFALEKKCTQIS
jgi:hypothetical protein